MSDLIFCQCQKGYSTHCRKYYKQHRNKYVAACKTPANKEGVVEKIYIKKYSSQYKCYYCVPDGSLHRHTNTGPVQQRNKRYGDNAKNNENKIGNIIINIMAGGAAGHIIKGHKND